MERLSSLVLALLLVITTLTTASDTVNAAPRSRWIKLRDVCAHALPWTGQAPLSLPARRPRDEAGVPMIIVDGERHYLPDALAINGMKRIDAYRDSGDVSQLQQALRQAERIRELSLTRRGAAWVPFWFDYLPAGQRAPWFDAMAQGLVLSFFVRLWQVTGDPIHMAAARGVFQGFLRKGTDRDPWVAYVDAKRFLWLEHYPTRSPSHVLNAHLHAIFGLYEYWQVTRSAKARRVLQAAIETMRSNAPRYRQPGGLSLYDLTNRTRIEKYHEIHIWQLRLLALISGDRSFARLARQLAADHQPDGTVPGRPAQHDGRFAGPRCRPASA